VTAAGDLGDLRDEIATCMRCGFCQAVCPVYKEVRREPAVARGKVALAEALLRGELEPNADVARQLDLCLTCKACVDACPSGVPVDEVILAARAEIVRQRGLAWMKSAIFEAVKRPRVLDAGVATAVRLQWLAMGAGPDDSLGVLRLPVSREKRPVLPRIPSRPLRASHGSAGHLPDPAGRVVFYPGCMITYVYPEIGRALVSVLAAERIEVAIPSENHCCGVPMLMHGDVETAKQMARALITALDALGDGPVLTACPTCGSALKHHVPRLLGAEPAWAPRAQRLAARTYDATQYLVDELRLDDAPVRSPLKVTYHDPCHLARGQGVRSQPRELIERVAGAELIELASPEVCCGGAGSFQLTHAGLAADIGAHKASEVEATGADTVVTSCPGCRLQLTDSLNRRGRSVRVCHTLELLAETRAANARPAATRGAV